VLSVLTEIKNAFGDICAVVCEGLEAPTGVHRHHWELATLQACLLHLIRRTSAQG
jgi:hypothetical protein